ncbi:MAG: histidine phosphatase family protein [Chlamydiales bacterium]
MQQNHSLLIMMRHGASIGNERNFFTGWIDIPLSSKGIQESYAAGKLIAGIPFDVIFVSNLVRAQMTAFLAMSVHTSEKMPALIHQTGRKQVRWQKICDEKTKAQILPVYSAIELNERYYGKLQGRNKEMVKEEFGYEQVRLWRRSIDAPPPGGESLAMTKRRVVPYFKKKIFPYLQNKKNVLLVAHGNSLRAIIMYLESLSKEEVLSIEVATGEPTCYCYRNREWHKERLCLKNTT